MTNIETAKKTPSRYLAFYISYFNIMITDGRYSIHKRMNNTIYKYLFDSGVSFRDFFSNWGLDKKWKELKSK